MIAGGGIAKRSATVDGVPVALADVVTDATASCPPTIDVLTEVAERRAGAGGDANGSGAVVSAKSGLELIKGSLYYLWCYIFCCIVSAIFCSFGTWAREEQGKFRRSVMYFCCWLLLFFF